MSGLAERGPAMRFYPTSDRASLRQAADGGDHGPAHKPEDPLLDILRVMLGMFAVFVAVWGIILLLTLGR